MTPRAVNTPPNPPPTRAPRRAGTAPAPMPFQLGLFDEAPAAPAAPAPKGRFVQLPGSILTYELKRAKRRSIGFTIDDRGLTVAAPRWVTIAEIEAAIVEKSRWIQTKLRDWQTRKASLPALRWADGAALPLLGGEVRIALRPAAEAARLDGACLIVPLPGDASADQIRDRVQGWMQSHAQTVFAERLGVYCERMGVAVGRWKLSSARARWGSCTADGTIRLNWRLLHFPISVVDYVIAHEIAHRREMNHGPRFWQTVEALFPEFKEAEGLLKLHAPAILESD